MPKPIDTSSKYSMCHGGFKVGIEPREERSRHEERIKSLDQSESSRRRPALELKHAAILLLSVRLVYLVAGFGARGRGAEPPPHTRQR